MKKKRAAKPYWEMTTDELREATKEFDQEFIADSAQPLTPEMQARWDQAVRREHTTMHIALLRGINVGGKNLVPMSELRDLGATLGLTAVRTLLQSGNLVFQSPKRSAAALERLLEAETAKRFGFAVDYFVRTGAELQAVIAGNPFPEAAERDPSHLVVMFHKEAPREENVAALRAAIRGRETVRAHGKHLFVVYPDGIGTSKLTGALIEKQLGSRGTARNWNTILKLAGMVAE